MNPCEWNNKITAWLLGELSENEREAMQRHIAGCSECKAAAEEMRSTIELLNGALSTPETVNIKEPKLDDSRRAMLLDIQPDPPVEQKVHWFFRVHPAFKAAAAILLVMGVVYLGSITMIKSSSKSSIDYAYMDMAKSAEKSIDASIEIEEFEDAEADAEAPVAWLHSATEQKMREAEKKSKSDLLYDSKLTSDMDADGVVFSGNATRHSLSEPTSEEAPVDSLHRRSGEISSLGDKPALVDPNSGKSPVGGTRTDRYYYESDKMDSLPATGIMPAKKPAVVTASPEQQSAKAGQKLSWYSASDNDNSEGEGRSVGGGVALGGDANSISGKTRTRETAARGKALLGKNIDGGITDGRDSSYKRGYANGAKVVNGVVPAAPPVKPAVEPQKPSRIQLGREQQPEESLRGESVTRYKYATKQKAETKKKANRSDNEDTFMESADLSFDSLSERVSSVVVPDVTRFDGSAAVAGSGRERAKLEKTAEKMVKLNIDQPKSQFTGTPKDIKSGNLEKRWIDSAQNNSGVGTRLASESGESGESLGYKWDEKPASVEADGEVVAKDQITSRLASMRSRKKDGKGVEAEQKETIKELVNLETIRRKSMDEQRNESAVLATAAVVNDFTLESGDVVANNSMLGLGSGEKGKKAQAKEPANMKDALVKGALRAYSDGDFEASQFLMEQASARGSSEAKAMQGIFADRLGAAASELSSRDNETFMTTADLEGTVIPIDMDRAFSSRKPLTPEEKKLADKLNKIVIPEVTFRPPATLQDAVDFFNSASKDYDDPEVPVEQRGVKIKLDPEVANVVRNDEDSDDPFASQDGGVPQISAMSARFINLYDAMKLVCDVTGTRFEIDGDKIQVLPQLTEAEVALQKYVKMDDTDLKGDETQKLLDQLTEETEEEIDGPREDEKKPEPIPFNPFVTTLENNFSTFAIDVDTASYTLTRRAISSGAMPDPESVRTEEVVNAFDYGDTAPEKTTFRVYQDGAQSRFGPGLNMLRIGVKGRRLGREEQRPAVLTLLVDTSGSMAQPDRIGLARQALNLLVDQLSDNDRIQIIAYNDHARLIQDPVPMTEKESILKNFSRLQCNGSTNLEEGMHLAYAQAAANFVPGAENRVILISDGVANLGAGSAEEILEKISAFLKQGITCSVFGVGSGTYNDAMLEQLANKGDGTYRFLDSEKEVKRAFVDDLAATLNTIAKDAKIQVEWNSKVVRRYRQLGYENRALTKEQFRDDTVDAGEVGSGQSVTALYELELAPNVTAASQLGVVRVRYQRTDNGKIEEIETLLMASTVLRPAHQASAKFRVAASAAEFAEQLRGCPHAAGGQFSDVADYLRPAAMELTLDTRVKELLDLVMAAEGMK